MDTSLAAYLPQDRRRALAARSELAEHTSGSALFADISGFTPLTEALDRAFGARQGTEQLTRHINRVYEALIAAIERFGGSVLGFAGDAITCWFDDQWSGVGGQESATATDTATSAALRAVACAFALQEAMRAFRTIALPNGTTAALALKVAVASGPARRLVVGDPAIQLIDTLAGATLARMAAGEHLAVSGGVLVDEMTVSAVSDAVLVTTWRVDNETGARFAVLTSTDQLPLISPSLTVSPSHPVIPSSEHLRPWLLLAVFERHQLGLGDFLAELRPVVALFLRFAGIDYDGDAEAGAKLDRFIRHVQAIVTRYDGALLQLTIGDKGAYVYATFGAPVAHEDDARRAAYAALDCLALAAALDFLQPVQVGISRGVLCVGAYGASSRKTYGALGDEVNLAARLMGRAVAGEALVSGRVRAELADTFTLEPLEPIPLKGMPEPLPVFRLAGLRRQAVRLSEPTYTLPMVGRAGELAVLSHKLDQTLAGYGQVVGIVAEAGMGKSRLVAEAIRLARRKNVRSFGGACQSYGTTTPYLMWEGVWRALFDLDPEMPLRRQIRALEGLVDDWAPERINALPLLGPLLGLNLVDNDFTTHLEPQSRKGALEALLLDCLRAAAREAADDNSGLLLVLEDLHWIDALSHDLLERVAQAIVDLPVLVVLAYRPPELLRLQAPRVEGLLHFTRVTLAPLTDAEAQQAIRAKLAQLLPERKGAVTPALLNRITATAQGNPFYVEELLNYLRDCGIDPHDSAAIARFELPSSLHTLILSRIDQLSAPQQATLKVASVIGRLFAFAWLHGAFAMLGTPDELKSNLDALAAVELTPLDTPEPELRYLFKHVVTQEVAYTSLTAHARARLHEQVATYLEQVASDDDERYVDLLAYHYDHSDNLPKRREYLCQAGLAAKKRYANDAALDYLNRAFNVAPEDDLVGRYVLVGERYDVHRVQAAWAAMARDVELLERLADALDDDWCRLEALRHRAQYALDTYDHRGVVAAAQQALPLAQTLGAFHAAADVTGYWSWSLVLQYQFAAARAQAEAALELVRTARTTPSVEPSAARALIEAMDGDTIETRITQTEAHILRVLGSAQDYQGDYAAAYASCAHGLRLFHEIGDQYGQAVMFNLMGEVLRRQGAYADAHRAYDQCVQLARATGSSSWEGYGLTNMTLIAHEQHNHLLARMLGEQVLTITQTIGERFLEANARTNLGHTFLELGQPAAAQASYQAALEIYRGLNQLPYMAEAQAGLARVALAEGDHTLALAHVDALLAYLADTGTFDGNDEPLRIALTCYEVLHATNDPRAAWMLTTAHAALLEQAVKISGPEMQRSFLENVPYHRAIVEAWEDAQTQPLGALPHADRYGSCRRPSLLWRRWRCPRRSSRLLSRCR